MKTVQYYLDLGVEFIKGDVVLGYKSIEYSRDWYKSLGDEENSWTDCVIKSFSWRNNDGVKPEYKGLIDVCLNNAIEINGTRIDRSLWERGYLNSVAKWRPVVLQSDDAKKEMQEKFLSALYADSAASKNVWNAIREQFCLPIGIDSPELREAFKSLKEHLENKPPFWNKSMPIFDCPCVAVNIETNKPTVSPKEDKPMKPVYTAEMHAKNELPPIGVECSLKSGFLNKWFNGVCVGYDEEFTVFKMCDGYPFVGMYVGFCLDRIKPIIKTIKVNGFDVPAPMSEAPEIDSKYFVIDLLDKELFSDIEWEGDYKDFQWLQKGIVHSTKSAAIAHAKAMLGIDPNA